MTTYQIRGSIQTLFPTTETGLVINAYSVDKLQLAGSIQYKALSGVAVDATATASGDTFTLTVPNAGMYHVAAVSVTQPGVWFWALDVLASASGDVVSRDHIVGKGAAITAVAGANNGTTPPAPVVAGDDASGNLTFGSGGTPAAGDQVDVTFAVAYAATPAVVLTGLNAATQALGLFVKTVSATGFSIGTANAPTASQGNTVYSVDYMIIG